MLFGTQDRHPDAKSVSRVVGGSTGRARVALATLTLALLCCATFFVLGRNAVAIQPTPLKVPSKIPTFTSFTNLFEAKFNGSSLRTNLTQTGPHVFERTVSDLAGEITQFHLVLNTSIPTKYAYLREMPCFTTGCHRRNNWRSYKPCADFDDKAAQYNLLGARTMERLVDSGAMPSEFEVERSLELSRGYFEAAVRLDPSCPTYSTNLAILMLRLHDFESAFKYQAQAQKLLSQQQSSEESKYQMAFNLFLQCFIYEVQNGSLVEFDACNQAKKFNTTVLNDFRGIFWVPKRNQPQDFTAQGRSLPFLVDMLVFKYFASLPLWQYAQISSFHQRQLAVEGYVTIRQIFPAYVFEAYRACYLHVSESIEQKRGSYFDGKRKRTQIMDDRCGRFLHYQTTDLIRILSNSPTRPTFTKFSVYSNGSSLDRHYDNDLCLWNLSVAVHTTSEAVVHDMILGLVDRKKQDVLEKLWPNDGLIFMGKELMHYRVGTPAVNDSLWQVFMHYDVAPQFKL